MKKLLMLVMLALVGCDGDKIELTQSKWSHHGVDVLVYSTFGKKEVLIRDAVAVELYVESYENCIKVYVNPIGDKHEVALARCGSGIGFRVAMRTELVEEGWKWERQAEHGDINHFSIDFGERAHHEEPEEQK